MSFPVLPRPTWNQISSLLMQNQGNITHKASTPVSLHRHLAKREQSCGNRTQRGREGSRNQKHSSKVLLTRVFSGTSQINPLDGDSTGPCIIQFPAGVANASSFLERRTACEEGPLQVVYFVRWRTQGQFQTPHRPLVPLTGTNDLMTCHPHCRLVFISSALQERPSYPQSPHANFFSGTP